MSRKVSLGKMRTGKKQKKKIKKKIRETKVCSNAAILREKS